MDETTLREVLRHTRRGWIALDMQNGLAELLPTAELASQKEESLGKIKKDLLGDTKRLTKDFPDEIPKKEGLDLVRKYQEKLDSLIESRTFIENRLIKMSPPYGRGVSPSVCRDWLEGLEELLAKASNPSIQPRESIPWF